MSFQSYAFLLLFLPAVLGLTVSLRRYSAASVKPMLIAASLLFHATWVPAGIPVLLASFTANRAVSRAFDTLQRAAWRRALLAVAILGNLALLIWFRYLLAWLPGFLAAEDRLLLDVIAPLGISFVTFTQIGQLLDRYAGIGPHPPLTDHLLFVLFFPAQIAGPVLTAQEMMPQFAGIDREAPIGEDIARGFGIFLIGLLKKTLLADPLLPAVTSGYADPGGLALFGAWRVALSYCLLLYFDFSGYSDMAVGAARMFGLRYPWNFASPYQARNVIEYWQRWHISLTRFFMATLHAPLTMAILRWRRARGLGVGRAAQCRPMGFLAMHVAPLTVTMALAGLWHGPSWTFLVFGLVHAGFLATNHAWRLVRPTRGRGWWRAPASIGLTNLCVLIGSVLFRAEDLGTAFAMLTGLAGGRGIEPFNPATRDLADAAFLVALLILVWVAPNTRRIMDGDAPWSWRPSVGWATASGLAMTLGVLSAGGTAEFLYARF